MTTSGVARVECGKVWTWRMKVPRGGVIHRLWELEETYASHRCYDGHSLCGQIGEFAGEWQMHQVMMGDVPMCKKCEKLRKLVARGRGRPKKVVS